MKIAKILLGTTLILWGLKMPLLNAQTNPNCSIPALSRVKTHRIQSGETLDSIARKYNLIPASLISLNPGLSRGSMPVGEDILIPPFNGRVVQVNPGESWQDLAKSYGVRADILFDVNGCQPAQGRAFIPALNSVQNNREAQRNVEIAAGVISGYPLAEKRAVLLSYGWQLMPLQNRQGFHSGIDINAQEGEPVLAAGDGTVAFAGEQGNYGNLVVINHAYGKQSRYAHLQSINVAVGASVSKGELLGKVGKTGSPDSKQSHLHFEVRSASGSGWVAEDPQNYFK